MFFPFLVLRDCVFISFFVFLSTFFLRATIAGIPTPKVKKYGLVHILRENKMQIMSLPSGNGPHLEVKAGFLAARRAGL